MDNQGLIFLLSFFIMLNSSAATNKIRIFKQWHLSPKQITIDIEKSKSLPQYLNQKNIYEQISTLIKEKKTQVIISEGCEGRIDENFPSIYNGWDYTKINSYLGTKYFSDILTLLPLKMKVAYKNKVEVICGDDQELIKKNMLAMSEARAFIGYYARLKQYKGKNEKKFNLYKDALLKSLKIKKFNGDIVNKAKSLAREQIRKFKQYIKERNHFFLKTIKKYKKNSPVVIIGGLHAKHLKSLLRKEKLKSQIITPKGYSGQDHALMEKLEFLLK